MTSDDERFRGFRQLIGDAGFERISVASVCVIGLGGVGSWVVEGLARSGVGCLTLVDLDEVCITNINRQLPALTSHIGRSKAEILRERVLDINPACRVTAVKKFFTSENADQVLDQKFDLVVDTIDSVDHKTDLILACVRKDLPMITVGSGGDRLNPLGAAVIDLAFTEYDPLLQIIRKRLRQQHNFPRGNRKRFNIPCIYAPQQRGPRVTDAACEVNEAESKSGRSCNDGLGSAVFVTGTLGFIAASEAIKLISQTGDGIPYPWKEKRQFS